MASEGVRHFPGGAAGERAAGAGGGPAGRKEGGREVRAARGSLVAGVGVAGVECACGRGKGEQRACGERGRRGVDPRGREAGGSGPLLSHFGGRVRDSVHSNRTK